MNQCQKIIEHIDKYGSITPQEAMEEYGIMRLGARIWDLKAAGEDIVTESVSAINRYGETVRFAKYKRREGEK